MAIKPVVILGGLVAAYFLTQKDAKASSSKSNPNSSLPKPSDDVVSEDVKKEAEETPPPPPPKNNKLPDLDIDENEDKPDPVDTDQENQIKINLGDYYSTFYQTDSEQPEDPSESDLWVSDTCLSWGIGKKFHGVLPAKIVLTNPPNPDKLIGPIEWWTIWGGDVTPAPHYFGNYTVDLAYRNWARVLIQYYTHCGDDIPMRKNFPTFKAYVKALDEYEKTPIGKLYRHIYRKVGTSMIYAWEKAFPDKEYDEALKWNALWAVRNYPKSSIDQQTNQAYYKVFPTGPKKINPNDPNHEQFKDAWIFMNIEIKGLRNMIKTYGDDISPLEEKE